jgi:DNA-nicking Smr family endonuclease
VAGRRLDAEERALWRRVTRTVRPLGERADPDDPDTGAQAEPVAAGSETRLRQAQPERAPSKRPASAGPGETLDGGWDRRLRRGAILPDRSLDLHGHTLASAHAALDHGLERALADGVRVLLVVTGRPPRADAAGPTRRGLIRAAIGDWLAVSRHASRIAAIRNAHPRHGGAGALYLILRRR